MSHFLHHVRVRPRLFISLATGIAAGVICPKISAITSPVTRLLVGWNAGTWLFLVLVVWMMFRADHARLRRTAIEQAESAGTVLGVVILAALVSLVAVILELAAAKAPGSHYEIPHVLFVLATVSGSWLLLPTLFAMSYASLYFHVPQGRGLKFPEADEHFKPDYFDFLYFSFTIAVATQTADVSVTSQPMRRLVLLQSLLSFIFNTTILAFTINIAASLF